MLSGWKNPSAVTYKMVSNFSYLYKKDHNGTFVILETQNNDDYKI